MNYWYGDRIFSLHHIRKDRLGHTAVETISERSVFQKKWAYQRSSSFAKTSKNIVGARKEENKANNGSLNWFWILVCIQNWEWNTTKSTSKITSAPQKFTWNTKLRSTQLSPVFHALRSNYFCALEKQIFPALKFNFYDNRNKTTDFLDITCEVSKIQFGSFAFLSHISIT